MTDPAYDPVPTEEEVPAEETDADEGEKYDGGPIPEASPSNGEE
jgi:hypothetical protein